MLENVKVGDQLYYVSNDTRNKSGTQVVKVGRKWITCADVYGGRVSGNEHRVGFDGVVDGGMCTFRRRTITYSSPGKVYLSKGVYEVISLQQKRWADIREYFNNQRQKPLHISDDDLTKLEEIFKITETVN